MTKEEIQKVLDLSLEYYKLEVFGTDKESQPPTQERIDYIYERIQPSLPSDLDEAAEISDLEAKNLADDYTKFLAAGLTNNEPRPIGPQWMKKLALDRFKAGAKWQKQKDEGNISWYSVDEFLPLMDEEVIVLTNEMNGHTLPDASHLCFAHRPNPKVAVCYDGWNIPGVKYWIYIPTQRT